MTLTFSVVINTLNRARLLENAIAGLRRQRHPSFEIIVVNGPSTDDTEAVLARSPDVRAGSCPAANLSMSRNIGIAMARGDVVAFLDDDAVPEPAWLERIETGYADARVGAVGGYIRDHTGVAYQSRVTVCDRFADSESYESPDSPRMPAGEPRSWRFLSPTGANATYRRSALLEIGGFDETFAYFLDETDVNVRLLDAGWLLRFVPGAEVHHKYAPSAQRDHRRVPSSLYTPCKSKAYFALRHARPAQSLGQILDHLAAHAMTLRWHNKNLLKLGLIEAERCKALDESVEAGLADGVALGFSSNPPPLLSEATLRAHAASRFRPITPRLPSRERLRLAFVSQEYPPGPAGGIGVWTETAARALSERGHEVTVIATATEGGPTIDFENGVWVHRIVPSFARHRSSPPLPDLPQSTRDHLYAVHDEVARIRAERGLDLVSWPIWDLEGLAVQASGLVPTVLSLHTTFALAAPSKPDWARNRAYRRNHVDKIIAREREVLKSAPFVIANSERLLADIEAEYGVSMRREGVWTIPHGLRDAAADAPRYKPGASTRTRILFVGRIEPRKGADVLLEALPPLLEANPNLEVRLAGELVKSESGPGLTDQFVARNRTKPWFPRIVFEGVVSSERLRELYAKCDIFVAPSRYESFGLVFLEAMMFAKPCVGAAAGGVPEVVVDGETGLLTPPGDPAALGVALARLIADPDLRLRLGAAGRQRYERLFSAEGMAEKLEAAYRAALRSLAKPSPSAATTLMRLEPA